MSNKTSETDGNDINPAGITSLLPWQESLWQSIWARVMEQRLPHALLFSGPEGLGKRHFAHYMAISLLCHNKSATGAPCGQCKACALNKASNHPDLVYLSTPEDRKNISIDQVRDVIDKLTLKSQFGHGKVVILRPADELNHNSSNALLKTLEEPPEGTVIILCSSRSAYLPATIRSRCQQISFPSPDASLVRSWLADQTQVHAQDLDLILGLAGNAPFMALQYCEMGILGIREELLSSLEGVVTNTADPVTIAAKWLKLGVKESLYCLHSWTVDIIRLKLTSDNTSISNYDHRQRLVNISVNKSSKRLYHYLDKVEQCIKWLDEPLNQQLMLEDILIEWNR